MLENCMASADIQHNECRAVLSPLAIAENQCQTKTKGALLC